MFKVTLKVNPNGEWIDGPVVLLNTGRELEEFSQQHEYFKVETASDEDVYLHSQRVPSAFEGFLS